MGSRSWAPFHRTPRALWVLYADTFTMALGFYLLIPLLAYHLLSNLGLTAAVVGALAAARTAAQQGLMPWSGWAADRLGYRRAIATGVLVRAVGFALLGVAEGVPSLAVACVLAGAGGSLFHPASYAAYSALAEGRDHVRVYATRETLSNLGFVLGPVIGGALAVLDFRWVCLVSAGLFGVAFGVTVTGLPRDLGADGATTPVRLRSVVRNRSFVRFCVLAGGMWLLFSQLYLAVPVRAEAVLPDAVGVGAIYSTAAVVMIATMLPLTRAARSRWRTGRILATGTVGLGAGLAVMGLWDSVAGLVTGVVIFTVGQMLTQPVMNAVVADYAPAGASRPTSASTAWRWPSAASWAMWPVVCSTRSMAAAPPCRGRFSPRGRSWSPCSSVVPVPCRDGLAVVPHVRPPGKERTMSKRHLLRAATVGGAAVLLAAGLLGPVQAASPPLIPGESVGTDPDEEWWEGITIPTEGVLPATETHPSSYVDTEGIAALRDRVDGTAPDPHGHYAMAWDRLVADADAAAAAPDVDPTDDVKTKAAKATAFAWLLTGEQRYLDAAVASLRAAFDTIVPTDQYVAQQMTNYALAYDWVAADLSTDDDEAIRAAVKRGADWLYEYLADEGVRSHNHRSKAGAALGSWALVFAADDDAQAYLDRGLKNLNRVFRYMFTEDGIYRDGSAYYWIFTIINSTPFLWQYRNVSGVDLFAALQPAFEWQLKTVNPQGLQPPLDDGWYKVTWLHTVAAAYADTPTPLSDTGSLGELFQWQFFASDWAAARYPDDWTGARDQFYGWPEEIALYDSAIAEVAPDESTGTIDMDSGPRGGDTIFRSDWAMGDPATRWGHFGGTAMSNNHDHADGLQLLIDAENAVLARDNGYGPQRFGGRDAWKGPEHHNVVTADGAAVGDPTPTRGFLSGSTFGFAEKSASYWDDGGAAQTRAVAFPGSDYFVVLDRLTSATPKTWDAYWHVRGEMSGVANRRTWTTTGGPWGDAARMTALTLPASARAASVTDSFNPYGTGEDTGFDGYPDPSTDVEETTGLRMSQEGPSAEFLSVLAPSAVDGTEPRLLDIGTDHTLGARVTTDAYTDTVVAPRGRGGIADGGDLTVAGALGWSRATGGAVSSWAMHDGTSVSWREASLVSASAPVTVSADVSDPATHRFEVAALPDDADISLTVPVSAGRPLVAAAVDGSPVTAVIDGDRVVVTLTAGGDLVLDYGDPESRPAAVLGVEAQGFAGAVELTWDPVPTATSYRVLRRGRQIAEVPTPSYTDTDVVDGRTYPYRVVAANENGTGRPSTAVPARAGAGVPVAPEGFVAAAGHAVVELSWLPVRDADSYQVVRDGAVVADGITPPAWTDEDVSNGTTYEYSVQAVNVVGTGPSSTTVAVTPQATPPDAPVGLSASRAVGSVTLTWSPAERADSYTVLRGGLTDDVLEPVATTTEPTFTDTDVTDGTGYTYQVVAENEAGASEPAVAVTAVPGCSLHYEVGDDGAVIEAELFSARSGAYETLDDPDRFGEQVIQIPPGAENKENPDLWGRYDLEIPEGGRWYVVVLGSGESGSNDSIYVSVDNGPPATVNLPVGSWGYRQSPIGFDLSPGFHTLLLKAREDGAMVDRFVIYPSDSIPDDVRFTDQPTQPTDPDCGDGSG